MRATVKRLMNLTKRLFTQDATTDLPSNTAVNSDVLVELLTSIKTTTDLGARQFANAFGNPHPEHNTLHTITGISLLLIEDFCLKHLFENEKYKGTKRVTHFQKRIYCAKAEDGIIEEIFNRIGEGNKSFIEFGVSSRGYENNSLYLLLKGWNGLWIEGCETVLSMDDKGPGPLYHYRHTVEAREKYIKERRLKVISCYITAENIEELFRQGAVPLELDLLSIDIDGNDYWVWKAIKQYRPRVVCIEYNSSLGDRVSCAMDYDPDWRWDGSYVFGASLVALEKLGRLKGYSLIGCDFTGINSYFVRDDLVGDLFCPPFTSNNHYEPNRYFLASNPGNWRTPGPFVNV
jgi:hypothetical protein